MEYQRVTLYCNIALQTTILHMVYFNIMNSNHLQEYNPVETYHVKP